MTLAGMDRVFSWTFLLLYCLDYSESCLVRIIMEFVFGMVMVLEGMRDKHIGKKRF